MRIVFLSPSGQMGGAEVVLCGIQGEIRRTKPDWQLSLIVSGEGPLAARARALGVDTVVLPFPRSLARIGDAGGGEPAGQGMTQARLLARLFFAGPGIFKYWLRLRRELRQLQPDVIHSNGFKMHILGALSRPAAVPLIWHIHDYVSSRPFATRLMKQLSKRCAFIVANSNSVKSDIETVFGNQIPVQTVYNAVDTNVFSAEGASLDLDQLSALPPPATAVVRVGLLATFARWKGQEVFLRAVSLIPKSIPLRAYVIGDELYETDGSQYSMTELKTVAENLGISDRVGFTGFVSEPAAAMRALDIVVHASTQPEPFGLVIIEGMACGRAVIASEAGGAAELIEDRTTALGFVPGDAAQLAQRIMQLANDRDLRARLGSNGRVAVAERFTLSSQVTKLIPIYEGVLRPLTSDL